MNLKAKGEGATLVTIISECGQKQDQIQIITVDEEIVLIPKEVVLVYNRSQSHDPEYMKTQYVSIEARISSKKTGQALDRKLNWSSSNENIVRVNQNGLISPVKDYGEAIITAESEAGTKASALVKVVSEQQYIQDLGGQIIGEPSDQSNPMVTYTFWTYSYAGAI